VYFLLEDYERVNPVTMKRGKLNYVEKMFEKGIINEEEYRKYIQKINENEPVNMVEIYNDRKDMDKDFLEFQPQTAENHYTINNIFKRRGSRMTPKMICKIYFNQDDNKFLVNIGKVLFGDLEKVESATEGKIESLYINDSVSAESSSGKGSDNRLKLHQNMLFTARTDGKLDSNRELLNENVEMVVVKNNNYNLNDASYYDKN
jgi:hypothetical protein